MQRPLHPAEMENEEMGGLLRLRFGAQLVVAIGTERGCRGHEQGAPPHACHDAVAYHKHRERCDDEVEDRQKAIEVRHGVVGAESG